MGLLSWFSAEKKASNASAVRELFEVTVIDGHNGSGAVHLRRSVLAISAGEALGGVLENWQPDRPFEAGISIQVNRGWVQRGGYRNDAGVALLERPDDDRRKLVLTEFDGTVTTFASDAEAWTYLQDHHYQSVNS